MQTNLTLGALVTALLLVGAAVVRASEDGDAVTLTGKELAGRLESGITVEVSIGAGCPGTVGIDPECVARLSHVVITVLDQDDQLVSQGRPNADGGWRVAVPPGRYTVRPERGPWITARAQAVTVALGQFARVQIAYESGVR
jgi:hypothetical protein